MTIAEESTAWPGVTRPTHLGGLGFGFKWNMGWMHDTLDYIRHEPIHRQYHHHEMTFSMVYAYSENFVLPISHDEVVHGKGSLLNKMPGDRWQQLATLRALYAYMWAHPGQAAAVHGLASSARAASGARAGRWTGGCWTPPTTPACARLVGDLNRAYRDTRALWSQDTEPDGFRWIDANDAAGNVFSFLRWGDDGSVLACVVNFSAMPHENYRLGLPLAGRWAGGAQHRRRGLRRLRRRQPGSGHRRRTPAGTASRVRPPSGCRRWAPSGCATCPSLTRRDRAVSPSRRPGPTRPAE